MKLRKQPVGKIIFVRMLLRNAHITLNACQAAEYFLSMPPSLVEWTSQGPRAKQLPSNNIWSDNYNQNDGLSDEDTSDYSSEDDI